MISPQTASFRVAGRTIQENLDRAMAEGRIVVDEDGRYRLAPNPGTSLLTSDTPTLIKYGPSPPPCQFLNDFLFKAAYGGAQVPHGCRSCYKILVWPADLRGLMALKRIFEPLPCSTKVRNEALDARTPNTYLGVVYADGLEMARQLHRDLRTAIDTEPTLGTAIRMEIRRGCTNYEQSCGPSDRYSFDPALEAIEQELAALYRAPPPPLHPKAKRDAAALLRLIQIAFQIGDETYKDFNGGKGLRFDPVAYDVDSPEDDGAGRKA
ncbi:hypothetical protein [Radicibacter daui]|uniref:hypothetical protein n=1 Tax=Radicibacter daui TaxID=3064829 RepID=UPI004046F79B